MSNHSGNCGCLIFAAIIAVLAGAPFVACLCILGAILIS